MAETAGTSSDTRYKIGDVCRLADVQPYVLRYWESEFPVLAPDKSVPGPRTYSSRELKLIEQIKRLLYDEGYTIAGAKKRLEGEAKDARADTNPAVAPIAPAEPPAKPARTDRVEKAVEVPARPERPERAPRPPRPARAPAATLADAPEIELPAPELTQPVGQAPADDRVVRAVAELREVLALLSRSAP